MLSVFHPFARRWSFLFLDGCEEDDHCDFVVLGPEDESFRGVCGAFDESSRAPLGLDVRGVAVCLDDFLFRGAEFDAGIKRVVEAFLESELEDDAVLVDKAAYFLLGPLEEIGG